MELRPPLAGALGQQRLDCLCLEPGDLCGAIRGCQQGFTYWVPHKGCASKTSHIGCRTAEEILLSCSEISCSDYDRLQQLQCYMICVLAQRGQQVCIFSWPGEQCALNLLKNIYQLNTYTLLATALPRCRPRPLQAWAFACLGLFWLHLDDGLHHALFELAQLILQTASRRSAGKLKGAQGAITPSEHVAAQHVAAQGPPTVQLAPCSLCHLLTSACHCLRGGPGRPGGRRRQVP